MAFTGLAKITVAKLDESKGTPAYTEGFRCGKAIELTIDRKYAEAVSYTHLDVYKRQE